MGRQCRKLVFVDAAGAQYRCLLMEGHESETSHTVAGRVRIGKGAILVSCMSCRQVYYRDPELPRNMDCAICGGKTEIQGRIGEEDAPKKI